MLCRNQEKGGNRKVPLSLTKGDTYMKSRRNAKGEGSFRQNPDGSVTHRKSVGFKPDGRRKVLTVTAPTKAACIKEMRKRESEWKKQKNASCVLMRNTVADLCHRHLQYQVENDDLRPKSIDRRESTILNQIEGYPIGSMQLQGVTSVDIDRHIRHLIKENRLSDSSILKALDILNAAYEWAVLRGDMETNPVKAIKPELMKKIKRISSKSADEADVVVLSEKDIQKFTAEALSRDRNGKMKYSAGGYLMLLLCTGMRCGEMIALRWGDVDWENGLLTIEKSASMAKNRNKSAKDDRRFVMVEGGTKNQKARVIQLTEDARKILAFLYGRDLPHDADDLITPTETGRMNTASNLEHRMRIIVKNAGLQNIKGGLHIFRKTFATQMYERGARVEEIAAYIGDLESTTRKYYIAIRKKVATGDKTRQIVMLPRASR